MSIELALRFIGGVLAGIVGWEVASVFMASSMRTDPGSTFAALFAVVAASFGIGFLITPYLTTRPFSWVVDSITHTSASDIVSGAFGLLGGLLVGLLLAIPMSQLPWPLGSFLPVAASITFGYFGLIASLTHKQETFALFGLPWEFSRSGKRTEHQRILLDTSAIIDGRIADIAHTGFLSGSLLVPKFILAELQRIADSTDPMRRNRGRRGLEILTRLQKDTSVELEILEADGDNYGPVDAQLVALARTLGSPIVTNDYNLNRVAGLQGVKVLNINELANAVKSVVLAGEEMTVKILQEGKEPGQGVAYLDDGTMIVVDNGRQLLNHEAEVVVSRVLQTAAGRMIFAQPKPGQLAHPASS